MTHKRTLGVWALVAAIVAPVWLIGGFYLAVFATRSDVSPVVQVLANVAVFGWFVVPIAIIAALVLGIAAIILRRGRALGVAALVVIVVAAIAVLGLAIAAFGGLGTFLG